MDEFYTSEEMIEKTISIPAYYKDLFGSNYERMSKTVSERDVAQRAERGFCDRDLDNTCDFLPALISKMLYGLANTAEISPKGFTLEQWKNELRMAAKDFEIYCYNGIDAYEMYNFSHNNEEEKELSEDEKYAKGNEIREQRAKSGWNWISKWCGYLHN